MLCDFTEKYDQQQKLHKFSVPFFCIEMYKAGFS